MLGESSSLMINMIILLTILYTTPAEGGIVGLQKLQYRENKMLKFYLENQQNMGQHSHDEIIEIASKMARYSNTGNPHFSVKCCSGVKNLFC